MLYWAVEELISYSFQGLKYTPIPWVCLKTITSLVCQQNCNTPYDQLFCYKGANLFPSSSFTAQIYPVLVVPTMATILPVLRVLAVFVPTLIKGFRSQ